MKLCFLEDQGGLCYIVGQTGCGKSLLLSYICRLVAQRNKTKKKIAFICSDQLRTINFLKNPIDFLEKRKYILSGDIARDRLLIIHGEKPMIDYKHVKLIDYVDFIDFSLIRSVNELISIINLLINKGYSSILIDDFDYLISVCSESFTNNVEAQPIGVRGRLMRRVMLKIIEVANNKVGVYITLQAQRNSSMSNGNIVVGDDRANYYSNRTLGVISDRDCLLITVLKDRFDGSAGQTMHLPISKTFNFKA